MVNKIHILIVDINDDLQMKTQTSSQNIQYVIMIVTQCLIGFWGGRDIKEKYTDII